MVKFVGGMDKFLLEKYPDKYVLISFGHIELFTDEMREEYIDWYKMISDVHSTEKSLTHSQKK